MRGEIIAIGDELTSGRILNSTSGFAARHLFAAGHEILAMTTIGDSREMIAGTLHQALARSDFIVITGGLGATSDDLTNEAVATALVRPTTFFPEIMARIRGGAKAARGEHPLEKLAWLPEGSEVLSPAVGMAGHLLVHRGKSIFFLPGVPEEMRHLMTTQVLPRLASMQAGALRPVRQRIYKVFGLGETAINGRLRQWEQEDPQLRIGYYPVFPEVEVSLSVLAEPGEEDDRFARYDAAMREALGDHLYGFDEATLESVVGGLLAERKQTVATAESCTGGLIAHTFAKVPGSSAYLLGGAVTYSNQLKEKMLQVDPDLIGRYGAVSGETARAMAEGCRRLTGADYVLSVTGIAGPSGGRPDKPVGTVYIGLAAPGEDARELLFHFRGNRWQIQAVTCAAAFDLLRRKLLNMKLDFQEKSR